MYTPSVGLVVAAALPNPNPVGLVPKRPVDGAVLVSVEPNPLKPDGLVAAAPNPPNPVDAVLVAASEKT